MNSSGALVLIVEDNDKNMKLVRDVLQYKGYRTLEATSAEAALEIVESEVPDVILMDIRLPGMDGETALRVLRARERTARIPVVAVTASVMPQDRNRLERAGFDGYLEKPLDIRTLAARVESFIAVAAEPPASDT